MSAPQNRPNAELVIGTLAHLAARFSSTPIQRAQLEELGNQRLVAACFEMGASIPPPEPVDA